MFQVHGAEILCSQCGSGSSADDDMSRDIKWLSFLESLKHKGYFKVGYSQSNHGIFRRDLEIILLP